MTITLPPREPDAAEAQREPENLRRATAANGNDVEILSRHEHVMPINGLRVSFTVGRISPRRTA